MIYAWLRWLNRTGKQTAWRFMLWRWRATHEDRTRLKQQVRGLGRELGEARENLVKMMPDDTSVLIPVSTLEAISRRAERHKGERDEALRLEREATDRELRHESRATSLEAALRELVRLKDEKGMRSQPPGVPLSDAHHRYYQEKEAAWQAARALIRGSEA